MGTLAKMFSLKAFVDELIADLDGPELSWNLKVSYPLDPRPEKTSMHIEIPIKLYGKRKGWVREKVLVVAEHHGLQVDRSYDNEDLCLWGAFADILCERI